MSLVNSFGRYLFELDRVFLLPFLDMFNLAKLASNNLFGALSYNVYYNSR